MRRPERGSLLLALLIALSLTVTAGLGCNWLSGSPKPIRQGVVITCNQPKALLYVNERLVGPVGKAPGIRLGLTPGKHRVAVKLAGFFSRYFDVTVKADVFERLRVTLVQELD